MMTRWSYSESLSGIQRIQGRVVTFSRYLSSPPFSTIPFPRKSRESLRACPVSSPARRSTCSVIDRIPAAYHVFYMSVSYADSFLLHFEFGTDCRPHLSHIHFVRVL